MAAQYVPPDPTTWTWVVTSKAAGEARPCSSSSRSSGSPGPVERRRRKTCGLRSTRSRFSTEQTATERASGYWTLLVGLAAGLVTLIGLWQAVRGLRKRSAKGEDEDAPSHKA